MVILACQQPMPNRGRQLGLRRDILDSPVVYILNLHLGPLEFKADMLFLTLRFRIQSSKTINDKYGASGKEEKAFPISVSIPKHGS
jgi:hypothetical protein